MNATRRGLAVALAVAGLVAGGLAGGTAGAAWGHDSASGPASGVSRSAPDGVPTGFEPTTSWWTSSDSGFVGGQAPCDGDRICPVLLETEDSGATWSERTAPDGRMDGLMVAESGNLSTIVVDESVSYDGKSWQPLVPDGFRVKSSAQVGEYVYLTTQKNGPDGFVAALFRAPIGSPDWERVEVPPEDVSGYYRQIDARGSVGLINSYPKRLTTTDGTNWTARDVGCGGRGATVGGDDAMYLLCGKDSGTNRVRVMVSSDAGETFSEAGQVDFPGNRTHATQAAAYGDTITLAGHRGEFPLQGCLATTSFDGGRSWQQTLDVGRDEELQAVDLRYTDAQHGILVCRNGGIDTSTAGADVYRTTDGGASWESLGLNGGDAGSDWFSPTSMSWLPDDIGYVLGWTPCAAYEYCPAIRRSDDGGQSWTELPAPKLAEKHDLEDPAELLFTERNGQTVGLAYFKFGGLYMTDDGGQTWEKVDIAIEHDNTIVPDAGLAATDSHLYAALPVGDGDFPNATQVYRAPIGTNTWEPVEGLRAKGTEYFSLDFEAGTGVAKLGGGNDLDSLVFTSTDDGDSWVRRPSPCENTYDSSYFVGGPELIYAQCDYDSEGVLRSTDGGERFAKTGTGPNFWFTAEAGWVSGDGLRLGSGAGDGKGCQVFSSPDRGASWSTTRLDGPTSYGPAMLDMTITENGAGAALCGYGLGNDGSGGIVLSHTSDGGQSWHAVDLS